MELEIKNLIAEIGATVAELHATNDAKIKAEVKGQFDGLNDGKLLAINAKIDELSEFKAKAEAAINRTNKGNEGEKENASDVEYKSAFNGWARKGKESDILEQKALSVGSEANGGYLVTPTMSTEIIKFLYETSPMRQVASVQTISSDTLEIMTDMGEVNSGWVAETQARPETNTPQLGMRTIPVHEIYANPSITQKLLDDANINVESWLAGKIADKFARDENTAFINGDGVGKPRGILTYAAGTNVNAAQVQRILSGASGAITADSILRLFYALKDGYVNNAAFMMNRSLIQAVRLLKDTTNQYIWQQGLVAGAPDVLLGKPIVTASDMPTLQTNGLLTMAFGDFRQAYQIVDRIGIRTLRDPFTKKPFVLFYTTKRVGGDVKNFEAYKILEQGA